MLRIRPASAYSLAAAEPLLTWSQRRATQSRPSLQQGRSPRASALAGGQHLGQGWRAPHAACLRDEGPCIVHRCGVHVIEHACMLAWPVQCAQAYACSQARLYADVASSVHRCVHKRACNHACLFAGLASSEHPDQGWGQLMQLAAR